jgi:hypothetical protein
VIADLSREMREGKKKNEPAIRAVTETTFRGAPKPVLPYQAMTAQISMLTIQRTRLAAAIPAGF